MPAVPIIALAVSAGLAVSAVRKQKQAASEAADVSLATANYNQRLDESEAQQTDLDAQENARALRRDAAVYMSRQSAAYAASGVRVDSGSPLAVQAVTAGRFALKEAQIMSDARAREDRLRSAGAVGIDYGRSESDRYHMESSAAVMRGAASIVGSVFSAYQGGAFSNMAGTRTSNLSSGLSEPGSMGTQVIGGLR